MATLVDILRFKYAGRQWKMKDSRADLYANLTFLDGQPAPTEEEMRAFAAEVDALVAEERRLAFQQRLFNSENPDALLRVLETLTAAVDDLQQRNAAGTVPSNRIDALRDKLAQIRAATPKE